MSYEENLKKVSRLPKYHLGQEINTSEGKGIIVSLKMSLNGLYISPERSEAVVWFGVNERTRWVQKSFSYKELSEFN